MRGVEVDRFPMVVAFFSGHVRDKVLGVSLLADQARAVPREIGTALAGINGDFYVRDSPPYSGDPRGLQIVNGDLISAPDTVCIWFDTNGNPRLDDVKGASNVPSPHGPQPSFRLTHQPHPNLPLPYT